MKKVHLHDLKVGDTFQFTEWSTPQWILSLQRHDNGDITYCIALGCFRVSPVAHPFVFLVEAP